MTEFVTEHVVDLASYRHLSPANTDKHDDKGPALSTDKKLEGIQNGRSKSERVHGARNSEECEQNFVMEQEYHAADESARLARADSPESAIKTESKDPDVKPTHSYIALIAMAILSCPSKKMILGDIYQYISDNFPYYRNKDKSWRNSIRHNLSLNECFIKAGRSENGKGNYWAIHPANLEDFANGDFRRRRARRRVRRSNSLKFGGSSSAYFRGLGSFSTHSPFYPYRTDDCRMHPSLTYIRPTKKRLAIDSIMGSYDLPYLYSPVSVRSYPSLSSHNNRNFAGTSSHSLLFHGSPSLASHCAADVPTSSVPGCARVNSLESSAFSAYFVSKGVAPKGQDGRSESWQETLSKLQEQLKKVTPWFDYSTTRVLKCWKYWMKVTLFALSDAKKWTFKPHVLEF